MTIRYDTCRSCNAKMLWAVTENGKRIPLDVEPTPTGNLVLVGKGNEPMVHYLTKDEQPTGDRYTSHFATCKDAKEWSKSRR